MLVYILTPWSKVLLEKLSSSQLVKKFPAFYGTQRFITAFMRPTTCPCPEQCLHYTFMEVQEGQQILQYYEAFCKYLCILDVHHNCVPH